MKPWKQGRHGARLKDCLLTEPGVGVSRMPYAPEGASGIKKKKKKKNGCRASGEEQTT
jgi:hypothetical protein